VRLDIRRIGALKDGENVIGNRTRVKIVKNKMAPPFKETEFDILYGEGISKAGDILDMAAEQSVVEKSGAWYTYKDDKLGHGRDNAVKTLKENDSILKRITAEVMKKAGIVLNPEDAAEKAADAKPEKAAGATVAGASKVAVQVSPSKVAQPQPAVKK
jgi:recombination protein RecA